MKEQNNHKSFYETEALEKPLWGRVREIALFDNISSFLPRSSFLSIIDTGCGDGFLMYNIRRRFFKIVGFDLSINRLKNAKKKLRECFFVNGNVKALPFNDKSFDIVICSEVLEHIDDYPQALDELARIAKKRVIVTVPYRQEPILITCPECNYKFYLSGHMNYFTGHDLVNMFLEKGFVLLKIRRFHTIYSYNRFTLKWMRMLRIIFDQLLILLSRCFSFFKPNYVAVIVQKKD